MSGDFISREAAIVRATKGLADDFDAYDVKVNLEAIPAADVVEVVRCRECKHHDGIRCFRWNSVIVTGFDDYCSNGERKNGGQDDGE